MTQNLGWERALIGTVLASPETVDALQLVRPSDFTGHHQYIWAKILQLYVRGAVGERALIEALRTEQMLDRTSFGDVRETGEAYITSLLTWRGEEPLEYERQVVNSAIIKSLLEATAIIRGEAIADGANAEEVLDGAETRMMQLRRTHGGSVSVADIVGTLLNIVNNPEARARNRNSFQSSVPEIETVMSFSEPDDYIILASRPGMGKSSLLRSELLGKAKELQDDGSRRAVGLINMENNETEVIRSFASSLANVDKLRIKENRMTNDERQRVRVALEELMGLNILIETMANPSAAQVARACRKMIAQHDVALVGVDYVQLMMNGVESKVQDVALSSATLRGVALSAKVPMIAAAQMSRSIEQRADKSPVLSDLKESGSLEQDATTVIFIDPVWKNPTSLDLARIPGNVNPDGKVVSRIIPIVFDVAKNRNGPVGRSAPVLFKKHTNQFASIAEGAEAI